MSHTDAIAERPLESGWEKLREMLAERNTFSSTEIQMFRLVYMFGARTAILSSMPAFSLLGFRTLATEIQAFDREVTHVDQQR